MVLFYLKEPSIDYSKNNELRKLQFFGAGPKAAIPDASTLEGRVWLVPVILSYS